MGKLKELRAALIDDLGVLGVPVMDMWSIRADPPCIYVSPPQGGNYVDGGPEYGASFVMHLDVLILVEARPPDEGRDQLEDILERVLINSADWALAGVEPPARETMSDSTIEFLGIIVHIGKKLQL